MGLHLFLIIYLRTQTCNHAYMSGKFRDGEYRICSKQETFVSSFSKSRPLINEAAAPWFYLSPSVSVTWFSGSDRTCLIIFLSWDDSTSIMGVWKNEATYLDFFSLLALPSVLLVQFIIVQCRCVWFGGMVFSWSKLWLHILKTEILIN